MDLNSLFDSVIAGLLRGKVLKHFEPVLPGRPLPDWAKSTNSTPAWYDAELVDRPWSDFVPRPPWAQVNPTETLSFEEYQPVNHIGDVPVALKSIPSLRDPRRQSEGWNPPESNQEQIRQKSMSIRLAAEHYMPPDAFQAFLFGYWTGNYAEHPVATDYVLGNILEQLTLCKPGRSASNEMVRSYLERAKKERSQRFSGSAESAQELARTSIILANARWDAQGAYIKLVAAIALYQSAVVSYSMHLMRAVRRHPMPYGNERAALDDKEVARRVIGTGLKPLRQSVVFGVVLTLAIINHQERSPSDFSPEAICGAIRGAWQDIFESNILRTELGDARMVCAGNQHLRFLKDARIMEQLYVFVDGRQGDPRLSDLEKKLAYACGQAHCYRNYYYRYFLGGNSKAESVKKLLSRMAQG
jgi:hypothetical protein